MTQALGHLLLEHGNEILLLVDPSTLAICSTNAAATRHLGYSRAELIGDNLLVNGLPAEATIATAGIAALKANLLGMGR